MDEAGRGNRIDKGEAEKRKRQGQNISRKT